FTSSLFVFAFAQGQPFALSNGVVTCEVRRAETFRRYGCIERVQRPLGRGRGAGSCCPGAGLPIRTHAPPTRRVGLFRSDAIGRLRASEGRRRASLRQRQPASDSRNPEQCALRLY